MDLGARLLLITSLGQLKQLRIYLPRFDFLVPPDVGGVVTSHEFGHILHIADLEIDLYGRLSRLVNFLSASKMLGNKHIEFEADLESNEDFEDFSILLNAKGEVILLHTSHLDKNKMIQWILVEWTKRIANLYESELITIKGMTNSIGNSSLKI